MGVKRYVSSAKERSRAPGGKPKGKDKVLTQRHARRTVEQVTKNLKAIWTEETP